MHIYPVSGDSILSNFLTVNQNVRYGHQQCDAYSSSSLVE